jgi:hypothetical protein
VVLVVVNAVGRGIVGLLETVGTPFFVATALTDANNVKEGDWQQVCAACCCCMLLLPGPHFPSRPLPRMREGVRGQGQGGGGGGWGTGHDHIFTNRATPTRCCNRTWT